VSCRRTRCTRTFSRRRDRGDARLAYAALMIGKESIAFNDRTGMAGDFLEKLLDFYFKLHAGKHTPAVRAVRVGRSEHLRLRRKLMTDNIIVNGPAKTGHYDKQ
jgi:hypothetical protein